jgi:very-short-patch-repair endonuclease
MKGQRSAESRDRGGEIARLGALVPDVRNQRAKPDPDALIARLAGRQHGVVSVTQLRKAGISKAGTHRRVRAHRLHPLHRGVYAVGHTRLSEKGHWMAAVLACGEGAVLSHLSAAELWRVRRRVRRLPETSGRGELPDVHVTVQRISGVRRRNGIILHRSRTLMAGHRTRHDGIPVTTPARTLADIRPLLTPAQFSAAIREAEFLKLPIDQEFDADHTRTDLEGAMLAICRRHRLPRPEVNVKVDRFEVDFLWRAHRLIVEVDGWEAHRSRSAFEDDRARDARLAVLGYEVVRFTWRRLTRDGPAVARTIRALLRTRAA